MFKNTYNLKQCVFLFVDKYFFRVRGKMVSFDLFYRHFAEAFAKESKLVGGCPINREEVIQILRSKFPVAPFLSRTYMIGNLFHVSAMPEKSKIVQSNGKLVRVHDSSKGKTRL